MIAFPETLLPTDESFPYYIVVPPYVRTSAGVAALHVLCHWLNMTGYNAFLYLIPQAEAGGTHPRLQTPLLDASIAAYHYAAGLTPIAVYPEVLPGNPFCAQVRARWIGNYLGLLGGSKVLDPDEMRFAHSEHLIRAAGTSGHVLNIPVADTSIFRPSLGTTRSGTCYYARKFQDVHGKTVFGLPSGSVEITRSFPATRRELAALFQRSELFYCFEDSALMNEAALCGCPVVMMKNDLFEWPLGIEEVGWDGYAWGDAFSEIERARSSVVRAYDNYVRNVPRFFSQLHTFVLLTQARARAVPYQRKVTLPGEGAIVDEVRGLRQRLAETIIALSATRADFSPTEVTWVPDVTVSGAQSAVTFISGWNAIDSVGAHGGDHCALTVCPNDVGLIELLLELDAAAGEQKTYEIVYDFDVHRRLTLRPGLATTLTLPVLDPGRPIFITLTAVGSDISASVVLKSIRGARRSVSSFETQAISDADRHKPDGTKSPDLDLTETTTDRIQAVNCSVLQTENGLVVEASVPDPQMLVAVDAAGWDGFSMPAFLWGAYTIDRDESLQVYMPTTSGEFAESVSCKVSLKKGTHVFVKRLPHAASVGSIRIDPIELPGSVRFSILKLVFVPAERPGFARLNVPVEPRLERFARQSLIDGAAFPLAEQCVAGYARNAFEIRASGSEASVIFYLGAPISAVEAHHVSIYLACESTLAGDLSIRFPQADGNYSAESIIRNIHITRGYQTHELQVFLSSTVNSIQLVLGYADRICFFALYFLVLRVVEGAVPVSAFRR